MSKPAATAKPPVAKAAVPAQLVAQIQNIINNLSKKNFKASVSELGSLAHEPDVVETQILKLLINQIDWKNAKQPKDQNKLTLLQQRITQLANAPNLAALVSSAMEDGVMSDTFVSSFVTTLKLSQAQALSITVAMAQSQSSAVIRSTAIKYLQQAVPAIASAGSFVVDGLPDGVVHDLVALISTFDILTPAPLLHLLTFLVDLVEDPSFPAKSAVLRTFQISYGSNPAVAPLLATVGQMGISMSSNGLPSGFSGDVRPVITAATIIEDLGFACSSTSEAFRKVLAQFPLPLTPKAAAEILTVIGRTAKRVYSDSPMPTWNVAVIAQVLQETSPELSWPAVIENLDTPECRIPDSDSLKALVDLYQRVSKRSFPAEILVRKWRYVDVQWSILRAALATPEQITGWEPSSEVIAIAEGLIPPVLPALMNFVQPYTSLPVVCCILRLSQESPVLYSEIWNLFGEGPVANCASLLILSVAVAPIKCAMRDKLIHALFFHILPVSSHHQTAAVVARLWRLDKELVYGAFLESYSRDPSTLSRLLDIALEVQELKAILDWNPLQQFAIDLACLASLRDALDLSRWIDDCLQRLGASFAETALVFMKDRIDRQRNTSPRARTADGRPTHAVVAPEAIQTILDRLRNASSLLSPSQVEELSRVIQSASEPAGFSPDIEEEANKKFQMIYSGAMSIEDAIITLRNFKSSQVAREQKIFQCMIRNLFDEYRFFPKYPEAELRLTGILFGSLIQHQLVSFIPLGIALRYVLEALKNPLGSRMFMFGVVALEQFTSRLTEWPQYCMHLKQIPSIRQVPQLSQIIDASIALTQSQGVTGMSPTAGIVAPPGGASLSSSSSPASQQSQLSQQGHPNVPPPGFDSVPPTSAYQSMTAAQAPQQPLLASSSQGSAVAASTAPKSTQLDSSLSVTLPASIDDIPEDLDDLSSHALNIGTLTKETIKYAQPDEETKDTIHFIFNNVSVQNIDLKAQELKKILNPIYYDYLAQYIVTKRASLEDNFQELYVDFIERLNLKELNKKLVAQTARSVRQLIASEKIRTELSERSLLKNLGNFVGLLTVARDRPLRHIHLPLKNIIIDAYETGKLFAVVPLTAKILTKCAKTRWFKLPCPWTMALVRFLVEIYHLPQIKLGIKFEVEILAGLLDFSIANVPPTDILKSHRPFTGPGPITDFEFIAQNEENSERPAPGKYQLQYIHISPGNPLFAQNPALKKAVYVAINRAIQDILMPVVERSVLIASVTTKELVLKDFSMEPDEAKMMRAAFAMVQSLAGNLASVTSKESLRGAMLTNLRSALSPQQGKPVPAQIEHAIQVIVQDNLELACGVVQKAAADASLRPTEEHLVNAVNDRKKHRERTSGKVESFYDVNFVGSPAYAFVTTLPEFLRPKMGGVTQQQLHVYDEFLGVQPYTASVPGTSVAQSAASPTASAVASSAGPAVSTSTSASVGLPASTSLAFARPGTQPPEPPKDTRARVADSIPLEQATKIVDQFIVDLSSAAAHMPTTIRSLAEVPADHVIISNLSHAPELLNLSTQRLEVAMYSAQRVFAKLFDERIQTPVHREVFLSFLDALTTAVPKLRQHLTEWLIFAPETHRYHREIVPLLLHAKLLATPELDAFLAKLIASQNRETIDFASFLVQTFMVRAAVLSRSDFTATLDQLAKIGAFSEVTESAQVERVKRPDFDYAASRKLGAQAEQKVLSLIDEWSKLFPQLAGNDRLVNSFVQRLQQGGYYGGKEAPLPSELLFYRVAIEFAVAKASEADTTEKDTDKAPKLDYSMVDQVSKLLMLLVRLFPEKGVLFARILTAFEKSALFAHNSNGLLFDQRPYHRLLVNFLVDLNASDSALEPFMLSFLVEFADTLHALRPSATPCFAFAWSELVSHRYFMPRLLREPSIWSCMEELLVDLLRFMEPSLRTAEMSAPLSMLYQGTLRVLLILLHDFPEFLCEYHFSFCDVIPTTCIQLRNLILSAFPRTMKLPDPFTPNLKVDLLPEITEPPRLRSNFVDVLAKATDYPLKQGLDQYLKTTNSEQAAAFLGDLLGRLRGSDGRFNLSLINAIVLYVCSRSLLESALPSSELNAQAPMELFRYLAVNLDTEGRYLLFNAIGNQLRYPNNHTHYFSRVLLLLFEEATQEVVQEQITRVLVERLIVHRPHPWGLLITFIELIKNPQYGFWNRNFTRIAPEIERLFFQVGTSIASHKTAAGAGAGATGDL